MISNNQAKLTDLQNLYKSTEPNSPKGYIGSTIWSQPFGVTKVIDTSFLLSNPNTGNPYTQSDTNILLPSTPTTDQSDLLNGNSSRGVSALPCSTTIGSNNNSNNNTNSQNNSNPAISNTGSLYPYCTTPRTQSLDFSILIDNQNTIKGTFDLSGWGDLIDGICNNSQESQDNQNNQTNPNSASSAKANLVETDRNLTDSRYFNSFNPATLNSNKPNCTTPLVNSSNLNTTYTPQYVVRGNQIDFYTNIEKNQRVVLGYSYKNSSNQNNTNLPTTYILAPTQVQSVTTTNNNQTQTTSNCTNNTGTDTLSSSTDNAGNPIPNSQRYTTKFKDTCKIKFTFTFPDDGKGVSSITSPTSSSGTSGASPTSQTDMGYGNNNTPANNYQFSFYSVDLAGNLSTYSVTDQTNTANNIQNTSFNTTSSSNQNLNNNNNFSNNPAALQSLANNTTNNQNNSNSNSNNTNTTTTQTALNQTRSGTVTVYHDTLPPQNTQISNIESASYAQSPNTKGTINNLALTGNTIGNTPITKDTSIVTTHLSDSKSDIQYEYGNLTPSRENSASYTTDNQTTNPNNQNNNPNLIGGTNITTSNILLNGFDENNNPITTVDQSNPNSPTTVWTDYTGKYKINLGNQTRDEDRTPASNNNQTCITISNSPIQNRRIGTCSDGLYSIKVKSADSAGNQTNWIERVVERDTVAPSQPTVNLSKTPNTYDLFEQLGLGITGEASTDATIQIDSANSSGTALNSTLRKITIPSSGTYQTSNILGSNLACGNNTYTVKVFLTDSAGNVSGTTQSSVTTSACPRCSSSVAQTGWVNPINNSQATITSGYMTATRPNHEGIDIGVSGDPNGTIPILAARAGTVKLIAVDQNGANYIDIDHGNGLTTRYVHLYSSASNFVSLNQTVSVGQQIGLMGMTGDATAPHLHFEVRINNVPTNPQAYVFTGTGNISGSQNYSQATQQAYFCNTTAGDPQDDTGSGSNGNGTGSSGSTEDLDDESYNIPTRQQISSENISLYQSDTRSLNDIIGQFSNQISNDLDQTIIPIFQTGSRSDPCLNKPIPASVTSPFDWLKVQAECQANKYQDLITKVQNTAYLLWGIIEGSKQAITDSLKGIMQIPSDLAGLSRFIWSKASSTDFWTNLLNWMHSWIGNTDQVIKGLIVAAFTGSADTSSIKGYIVSSQAIADWKATSQIVTSLVAQIYDSYSTKSAQDRLELVGKMIGSTAINVLSFFVGVGEINVAIEATTDLVRGLKVFQDAADFTKLDALFGTVLEYKTSLVNKLASQIDQTIQMAGQLVTIRNFSVEGIGITGVDALKIVDNASDTGFGDFVSNVVKSGDSDDLKIYRSIGEFCGAGSDVCWKSISELFNLFSKDSVVTSGEVADKNGLTRAGRALQKHAARYPARWLTQATTATEYNAEGQRILSEILDNSTQYTKEYARTLGQDAYIVRLSDGRGVRIKLDGTFDTFLDP